MDMNLGIYFEELFQADINFIMFRVGLRVDIPECAENPTEKVVMNFPYFRGGEHKARCVKQTSSLFLIDIAAFRITRSP